MKSSSLQNLLLLTLFQGLRQPLSLSTDSYLTALKALKSGFGIENLEDFKHLCCTVWAKSFRDIQIIEEFLEDAQQQQIEKASEESADEGLNSLDENVDEDESTDEEDEDEDDDEDTVKETTQKVERISAEDLAAPPSDFESEEHEPVKIVQAIRQCLEELHSEDQASDGSKWLTTEYFPATQHQMTKGWLRMQVPEVRRDVENIDLEAIVQEIGNRGFLLEPSFSFSLHRIDLIFLMDWKGSMVPFHSLCDQLVRTAAQGGQFRSVQKYYFYNYPDRSLFSGPSRIDATGVSDFLNTLSARTMVLVISDAGAARGRLNSWRVEKTQQFVYQLQQTACKYAWLNPMPPRRWLGNSAEKIHCFIPMFSMSHYTLDEIARLVRQ